MGSLGEAGGKEMFPSRPDPVMIELNRLEDQLRDKDRELGLANSEIKALKVAELMKDKAVVELSNELKKLDCKLRAAEKQLEQKNLENKKVINEKKEALAAQFAAEAALRRVHSSQKDEEHLPVEAVIAPLESDVKKYKNEIVKLQEDKKALERIMKSKEAALIEAENILHTVLERALIVETVQNRNIELSKQIEICQEENKLLEKTNRRKTVEVEKLTQTIHELEESILAGGAAANAVRDYQRRVAELNEEKRTLERELARARVSANRVATVVANEWKDDNDKVMPVKQWLQERRFLQGEIQRLRDKVAVAERTSKAEAQIKDKLNLRLKTLEEGLKQAASLSIKQVENSEKKLGGLSNEEPKKRSTSQPRASVAAYKLSVLQQPNFVPEAVDTKSPKKRSTSQPRASVAASVLQQPNSVPEGIVTNRNTKRTNSLKKKFGTGEKLVRKNLLVPKSNFFDDGGKENAERVANFNQNISAFIQVKTEVSQEGKAKGCGDIGSQNKGGSEDGCDVDIQRKIEVPQGVTAKGFGDIMPQNKGVSEDACEDMVSGFLYDRLKKEVINLRISHEEKDRLVSTKDDEIKLLQKKVDALTKAMEVELKKMRREVAAREKEVSVKSEDTKPRSKTPIISRSAVKHQEASTNART
ncbi:microtubule-associated protein 70-4-like isoform X2 [Phoenix dactylifera]|uniref:Microtubule-associated protein 70-4-like isoform X2 n=1 Tax=Phoenix dactylifera TaxID=42345 RepID=A0A8B7BUH4_PHODC|nr:microtubule-associated protein 70-4-like isoform X2 [Phoenix dactylifera]